MINDTRVALCPAMIGLYKQPPLKRTSGASRREMVGRHEAADQAVRLHAHAAHRGVCCGRDVALVQIHHDVWQLGPLEFHNSRGVPWPHRVIGDTAEVLVGGVLRRDSALILAGALDLSTRCACETTVLPSLYGARLVEQDFKS
jgi:hypothetical protein